MPLVQFHLSCHSSLQLSFKGLSFFEMIIEPLFASLHNNKQFMNEINCSKWQQQLISKLMNQNQEVLTEKQETNYMSSRAKSIYESLLQIQQYFQNLSLKIQIFTTNSKKQQSQQPVSSIDQLSNLMSQYIQLLHTKIKNISRQFYDFSIKPLKKQMNTKKIMNYPSIYEIPIQLNHISEDDQFKTILGYFQSIQYFQQIPKQLQERLLELNVDKHRSIFEIPIFMKLEETSQLQQKQLQSSSQLIIFEIKQLFNIKISNSVNMNCSKSHLIHQSSQEFQLQEHIKHAQSISNEYLIGQISTPTFEKKHYQNKLLKQSIQSPLSRMNFIEKRSQSSNQDKIQASLQNLKNTENIRTEIKVEKEVLAIYQIPIEIGNLMQEFQLCSSLYNIVISSKLYECKEKSYISQVNKQCQNHISFPYLLNPYSNTKSQVDHCNHVQVVSDHPKPNSENKYFHQDPLTFIKKDSCQSFYVKDIQGSRQNRQNAYKNKDNLYWSASIESFVIGSNTQKNMAQSAHYSPKKTEISQQISDKMIKEQIHEHEINSKLAHQEQKQISKMQSMAQHPQLNFCSSSEINEHISQSGNVEQLQGQKVESFLKSVSGAQNLSLKFKESCIKSGKNQIKQNIDPTGSIYTSLVQFNQKSTENKQKNKIYIIEAESSSQGSHSDRQMYVSQLKKKDETKNYESKGSQNIESSQNLQNNDDDNYETVKINEIKCDALEFYEMKQNQLDLEDQKNSYCIQLKESISLVEKLKQQLQEKQDILRSLDDSYQKKLHLIIQQISLYEEKLENLEEELLQKTQRQNALTDKFNENNKQLLKINEKLQQKVNVIRDLENYIEDIQQKIEEQNKIIIKQRNQKTLCLDDLNLQFNNQRSQFMFEVANLKQINIQNQKKLQNLQRQLQEKKHKFQEQKEDYEQVIRNLQQSVCDNKNKQGTYHFQFYEIYQEQLNKISESYQKTLQQKIITINRLRNENQRMNKEVYEYLLKIQEYQNIISRKDDAINELNTKIIQSQEQNTKISSILPLKAVEEIQFLRKQLIETSHKLEYAQSLYNRNKIKPFNQTSIYLEFDDQQENQPCTKINKQQKPYTQQLQAIIKQYQQIILQNYIVIKQLQQRVYEYLGDAMSKQKQEQSLYRKVLHSQSQLNHMLMQKISMQAENNRMKKMIAASQKKISSIGTRLIHAARKNLKDYSEETSNETHEIRNLKQAYKTHKFNFNEGRQKFRESEGFSLVHTLTK